MTTKELALIVIDSFDRDYLLSLASDEDAKFENIRQCIKRYLEISHLDERTFSKYFISRTMFWVLMFLDNY